MDLPECEWCSFQFYPKHKDQKFCSDPCRKASDKLRRYKKRKSLPDEQRHGNWFCKKYRIGKMNREPNQ